MKIIQVVLPNEVDDEDVNNLFNDIDRAIQGNIRILHLDGTQLLVGRLHTSL